MVEQAKNHGKNNGALGIDLGSFKAVVTHINSDKLDVILSESSDRTTPV